VTVADVYFADSSFWIAISSRRDQCHADAAAWRQAVVQTASRIVTTEAVLWEWLNALSHQSVRGIAAEGYRRVRADPQIEVVAFQPDLSDAAIKLYRGRADKNWSLTDCLSFVIMEQRALTEALTTDSHFEQAGFRANMLHHPSP
jgi:predicted nucleic acid-binding protein